MQTEDRSEFHFVCLNQYIHLGQDKILSDVITHILISI